MKHRASITLVALVILGAFWLMPASCAREPKHYLPKVGQKYEFLPVSMNSTESIRHDQEDLGGLHLTVRWGGRPLSVEKGNPTLNFYKKGNNTAFYSAAWGDLETAYKSSGCKNEQIETLDGPMPGVTLICDGRININEIERIEAVDATGESKSTTEFSTYKRADDVLAVIIQLY